MSNLRDLTKSEHLTLLPAAYQCEKPFKEKKGGDIYKLTYQKAVYRCKYTNKDQQDKSRYVVVKIAECITAKREIEALKNIRKSLEAGGNTKLSRNFMAYIESGDLEAGNPRSTFKWLSVEEVHPPMSICSFDSAIYTENLECPQAVPLDFFCQIHSALTFLHERVGIAHGDLNSGNIIVRFTERNNGSATGDARSPTGIEFVLIDFGCAETEPEEENTMDDMSEFRLLTAGLCAAVNGDIYEEKGWPEPGKRFGKEDWDKFKDSLKRNLDVRTGKDASNNLNLLGEFMGFAEKVIEVQRGDLETFVTTMWSLWLNEKITMFPEKGEDSDETRKAGKTGKTWGTRDPEYTGRPYID